MSPSRRFAISGNLLNGFDAFDLHSMEFVGTNDYLTTTRGHQIGHEVLPISSIFLAEDILVAGHKDPIVCIFKLDSHGQGKPIFFELRGAQRGTGELLSPT